MTSESRKQLKACLFLDLIFEDHGFGLGVVGRVEGVLSLSLTGSCGANVLAVLR